MLDNGSIYLGFDLSTQQLKCLAVTSDLKAIHEVKFHFDEESTGFGIHKGVLTNESEGEVYAPVALWLQAIDAVLGKLKEAGLDFSRVRGISGAGMQHGSVFWSSRAESILSSLNPAEPLEHQLDEPFSHPFSPNWQDASTQKECDEFDIALGSEEALAQATGSKAHHRFTGPQILRFRTKHAEAYSKTTRITLVSSFIASIFLGAIAPFDISDVCGMNLWDIKAGNWNEKLLAVTAGSPKAVADLKSKLGSVPEDGGVNLGSISSYFVKKYDFNRDCSIIASTGDNPSTILALPLRPNDAVVSLGTSTTFLMSTPEYHPDPSTHFFNHPTTPGLYMFMLCYKNGALAREKVRDAINSHSSSSTTKNISADPWSSFDTAVLSTPPLNRSSSTSPQMQLSLFFPRPEIVPQLPAGEWHYNYTASSSSSLTPTPSPTNPAVSARLIIESQFLSLRLRSASLVRSPAGTSLPPQPRRIYLVGGGSYNAAIARLAGEVLGGSDGIYRLDVGGNACALGAAYKAVWAVERKTKTKTKTGSGSGTIGGSEKPEVDSFEDFIAARWDEDKFVKRIADGYQKGLWEDYGVAVEGLRLLEEKLLKGEE